MATISPSVDTKTANGSVVITWSGMATGDTINAANMRVLGLPMAFASIHIFGTFGGATVEITGSTDDTNYFLIADAGNNDMTVTAEDWFEVSSGAMYVKPTIAGGTGDSVTVALAVWVGYDFR